MISVPSTNLRPDGGVLKVRNVSLWGKRILRWSAEIVDVEVGPCQNWVLDLVEAGTAGILASGVSSRPVASLKCGNAESVVPIEVQSSQ